MFKENPKGIIETMSQHTQNDTLQKLSQVSEGKLKIVASFVYYLVFAIRRIYNFFRTHRGELLIFLICYVVYRTMG